MQEIFKEIREERKRQDKKFGEQHHSLPVWNLILGEERGEVERAILDHDVEQARTELIEVAAVAVAMIQSIDRRFEVLRSERLWTPNELGEENPE